VLLLAMMMVMMCVDVEKQCVSGGCKELGRVERSVLCGDEERTKGGKGRTMVLVSRCHVPSKSQLSHASSKSVKSVSRIIILRTKEEVEDGEQRGSDESIEATVESGFEHQHTNIVI